MLTLTAQAGHDQLLCLRHLVHPDMTTQSHCDDADDLSNDLLRRTGIERARSAGHRYSLCPYTKSRASAIVVAYHMFKNASSTPSWHSSAGWPRANPNRNFLSQLLELEQGDGNDPSVALRAVAAGLQSQNETEKIITEDEIERVIEIDESAPTPADLEDDDAAGMDDDARMMAEAAAAAASAAGDDRDTAPVDALPRNHVETAKTAWDTLMCPTASPWSCSGHCWHRNVWWPGGGDDLHTCGPMTGNTVHKLEGHKESVCSAQL